MKHDIALKWAEALESGKYAQAREGSLRIDDGYCVLGVLCDLHALEHGYTWDQRRKVNTYEDGTPFFGIPYLGETTGLPQEVKEWAGIISGYNCSIEFEDIVNDDGDEPGDLSTLNDLFDYNFKQLAEIIRERFVEL